MASALPLGEPAPADGLLPPTAADGAADRAFGVYVHVPFCRVRCGYCDFNTYTSDELRGARQSDYAGQAIGEIRMSPAQCSRHPGSLTAPPRRCSSAAARRRCFPPATSCACSTPCGTSTGSPTAPRSPPRRTPTRSTPADLCGSPKAGFTRVSFGMQSAVPHVLAALDRTHDPARVPLVVGWAREAGLEVSLDLIYGTPGESLADWRAALESAIAERPDHLSAYALIVEDGTKLARQIRRGELAAARRRPRRPTCTSSPTSCSARRATSWYEVSNWATDASHRVTPQPRLLARRRLVGRRAGRAQPRRRRALVEREAPVGLRRSHLGRRLARRRPRDARRRGQARPSECCCSRGSARASPLASLHPAGRTAVAGLIADELVDAKAALSGGLDAHQERTAARGRRRQATARRLSRRARSAHELDRERVGVGLALVGLRLRR